MPTWWAFRDQIEERKVEPNSGLGEAIGYVRKHLLKARLKGTTSQHRRLNVHSESGDRYEGPCTDDYLSHSTLNKSRR